MLKRLGILALVFMAVSAGKACMTMPGVQVVYAQSLPATVTVSINPNPASENDTSYTFALDGGTPVVVQASACTATACSTTFSVASFGNHAWTAFATNQKITCTSGTCTGSPQNGPSAGQAFALNQTPTATTGQNTK